MSRIFCAFSNIWSNFLLLANVSSLKWRQGISTPPIYVMMERATNITCYIRGTITFKIRKFTNIACKIGFVFALFPVWKCSDVPKYTHVSLVSLHVGGRPECVEFLKEELTPDCRIRVWRKADGVRVTRTAMNRRPRRCYVIIRNNSFPSSSPLSHRPHHPHDSPGRTVEFLASEPNLSFVAADAARLIVSSYKVRQKQRDGGVLFNPWHTFHMGAFKAEIKRRNIEPYELSQSPYAPPIRRRRVSA